MALVEPDDIAARLQVEFDSEQEDAVLQVIDSVESQVASTLGRTLVPTVVTDEEVVVGSDGYASTRLWPVRAVSAVSAVALDGVTTIALTLPTLPVRAWGIGGLEPGETVLVTYTAGEEVAAITDAVRDWSAVEVQRQVIDGSPALAKLAVEGETLDYLPRLDRATILDRLSRYKRRVVR